MIYLSRGKLANHYTTDEPMIYLSRGELANHYTTDEPMIYLSSSPRFLSRPTALYILLEPWDVRALYIRKTADLPLQLLVGTFPRFVAIGFY
jgi:hypothetical protein